ncbi:MAG: hypothetical protein ACR2KM_07580, partial [Gemmatimonadaceae bacterium]
EIECGGLADRLGVFWNIRRDNDIVARSGDGQTNPLEQLLGAGVRGADRTDLSGARPPLDT